MPNPNPAGPIHFKSLSYQGIHNGPRLVVTGAVHGNETCGTRGIERVVEEIESGKLSIAKGIVTFIPVTNPLAYAQGSRNGDRNLNRNLVPKEEPVDFEDRIANWLCPIVARHEVLLDLHSTRGKTQAFAMLGPRDNTGAIEPFAHAAKERAWARHLGVSRFVEGWLGTYALGVERRARNASVSERQNALNMDPKYGVGTTEFMRASGGYAITLECGQHEDPQSPEVAYRAVRNTLAFLGITGEAAPPAVEQHEALRIHDVFDRNHPDDAFTKSWMSFDALAQGEHIATRADGTKLFAERAGRILFPDVDAKPGNEWFYVTETLASI